MKNIRFIILLLSILLILFMNMPLWANDEATLAFDMEPAGSESGQRLERALKHAFLMSYEFRLIDKPSGADYLIKKNSAESERQTWQLSEAGGKVLFEQVEAAKEQEGPWVLSFVKEAVKILKGRDSVLGSNIVFVAGQGNKRGIMKIQYGLEEVRVLADEKNVIETQPSVSHDGKVAWIRKKGGGWELLIDGQVIGAGEMHLSPAFAPDGSLVAAVSGSEQTSLYSFRNGSKELLLSNGGIAVSPAFSPDGKSLLYVANHEGLPRIFRRHMEGGGEDALVATPSDMPVTDPAWSPDGKYIAFVINETDIAISRPDGSELRQLTKDQGYNMRPSFSPDGRLLVFSSDRNGFSQLYVMKIDGFEVKVVLPHYKQMQTQAFWSNYKTQ